MDIGILGTGIVGKTIGSRLVELGHSVKMGARLPNNDHARAWARSEGRLASYGTFADAGAFGEILFNCTAGKGSLSALATIRNADLNDKILIDVANPLDFTRGAPPVMTVCNFDSLAEQIQREHPTLRVVKALNTMNVDVMVYPKRIRSPHDALLCGNNSEAKVTVARILTDWFGWDNVIDLGDLTNARGMEMVVPLWISLQKKLGTNIFNFKIAL